MSELTELCVAFRADASLQIGTGHVMRCLTLADALNARGARCHFICRELSGHLMDLIRQHGHVVHSLNVREPEDLNMTSSDHIPAVPAHCAYDEWRADAAESQAIFDGLRPDWLVVDHYGLDIRWEDAVRPQCRRTMVIDDLACRRHDCDLLLDQNLARSPDDYRPLVPAHSLVLTGPDYALLRPEFAALRAESLDRRAALRYAHLLITMGGVDRPNATMRVLEGLRECNLPSHWRITVVLGSHAPWIREVREQARAMPYRTEVLVDVADMATLMADSDLAIGAAGSTSWERCCLGLPALVVVIADNQRDVATALSDHGAAYFLGDLSEVRSGLARAMRDGAFSPQAARQMSEAARRVTDGNGVARVLRHLCAAGQG